LTLQDDGWNRNTVRDLCRSALIHKYAIIAGAALLYLYAFSKMTTYTMSLLQETQPAARFVSKVRVFGAEGIFQLYADPQVWGLSAINWQIVIFLLCGLSFYIAVLRRRVERALIRDLMIIGGPVLLLALAFIYADYPIRAFDYGVVIFILYFFVPRRGRRVTAAMLVALVYLSSFQIMRDKKIFFEVSPGEIEASEWVKKNCTERFFADEPFVNQLIAQKYYNLTGAHDFDPLTFKLFYADDKTMFDEAIIQLRDVERVRYVVLTQRMREVYVLMLDHPQLPIKTQTYFDESFPIVYANDDVMIYDIQRGLSIVDPSSEGSG